MIFGSRIIGLKGWRSNKHVFAIIFFLAFLINANAQTAEEIVQKIKTKLEKINDYEAEGKMKTNVAFIKAPVASVKVFYKKPDKLLILNETGISFIPKGSVNININNVFVNMRAFDIIDAGKDSEGLRVLKLLPKEDTGDMVLSTLYIDEKNMLVKRSKTTTKENGTYELEMSYGKYLEYGLPDRIVFSFNTKDYKLPKGITLDYDDGSERNGDKLKNKKGTVEINYRDYVINKGIDDRIFRK
jgi:outer membrane lipoprotein-sorting protein